MKLSSIYTNHSLRICSHTNERDKMRKIDNSCRQTKSLPFDMNGEQWRQKQKPSKTVHVMVSSMVGYAPQKVAVAPGIILLAMGAL